MFQHQHWYARGVSRGVIHSGLLLALLGTACQGMVSSSPTDGGPVGRGGAGAGANGGGPPLGGTGGSSGGGGAAGNAVACVPETDSACTGTEVLAAKRLVRLTFNQIANSVRALLGAPLAEKIATDFELTDATHRWFPPLSNPREGTVITDSPWDIGDRIAQAAAKHVADNFATVTGCSGTTATDACAQTYVRTFAAAAFRRPLTTEEASDVMKVYTDVKGFGGTIPEAAQFGVYAALESPAFLYRTEFGSGATTMGALSPYELASAISYFLTDGPPDPALLDAAAKGALSTEAQVRTHVTRILASDEAKTNLHGAMMGYFAIPALESILIDPGQNPLWNDGLRSSLYHESELFLRDALWKGKVVDLLTSRRSTINETLAPLYGVAWPPADVTLDKDGFGPVELPANRAGMLTQGGFLVARARPMAGSVIGRGLLVNAAFLCNLNPPFPAALTGEIDAATALLANATEKEKAAFRADKTRACAACHPNFDPYGLALENYDTLGQYRSTDDQGRPIDAQVTLPPKLGCASANGAVDLAGKLAAGNAFATCLAKNVLGFALAETTVGAGTTSCATRNVVSRFNAAGEGTFTSLVREIAVSQTLAIRNPGGAQ